jgi:hypothetical protein
MGTLYSIDYAVELDEKGIFYGNKISTGENIQAVFLEKPLVDL